MSKFQVEQLKKVLVELGSPHLRIPVIAIAGTNGKGSVSGMIQNVLTGFGKKTGLFTSPHILKFTERIQINGCPVPIDRFKQIFKKLRLAREKIGTNLTKFELMTAVAIEYFFEENCDLSVMEAGLGGRLDATNICENKLVSVVMPVSLDHTEYLGDTRDKIATEKAGIIKDGNVLVDASGVDIVRNKGLEKKCRIYTHGVEYKIRDIRHLNGGNYEFTYVGGGVEIKKIRPGLRGIHQVYNAAAAITAVRALGFDNEVCVKTGVQNVYVPGRLEVFDLYDNMKLIVDAAHNPAGMETVKDFINRNIPVNSKLYLIMGVYRDKDYKNMVRIIESCVEEVWTITPANSRALDGRTLSGLFKCTSEAVEDFGTAFNCAVNKMRAGDWLLACGSFSVVKPALELVNAQKA